LFRTVGVFLRNAKVPKHQRRMQAEAWRAFDVVSRTVYSREAKRYPCTTHPLIPMMALDLNRICLGQKPFLPPTLASRAKK